MENNKWYTIITTNKVIVVLIIFLSLILLTGFFYLKKLTTRQETQRPVIQNEEPSSVASTSSRFGEVSSNAAWKVVTQDGYTVTYPQNLTMEVRKFEKNITRSGWTSPNNDFTFHILSYPANTNIPTSFDLKATSETVTIAGQTTKKITSIDTITNNHMMVVIGPLITKERKYLLALRSKGLFIPQEVQKTFDAIVASFSFIP